MIIIAYFVHNLNPGETKPTASGIISILAVYVFAFSFSVSLGPISWNVCSEVRILSILSSLLAPKYASEYDVRRTSLKPDTNMAR